MSNCGHKCDCHCHRLGTIACVRCFCKKCYVCDGHVYPKYFQTHLNFCHEIGSAFAPVFDSSPVSDSVGATA